MSQRERELIAAFGQLATGFNYDTVIAAAADLMLNGLRQKHAKHIDAEEQLDELIARMRLQLERKHYHPDGTRNDRRIVLPPLSQLVEGGVTP